MQCGHDWRADMPEAKRWSGQNQASMIGGAVHKLVSNSADVKRTARPTDGGDTLPSECKQWLQYHAAGRFAEGNVLYKCIKFARTDFDFKITPHAKLKDIPSYIDRNAPLLAFNGPLSNMLLSQGKVLGNEDTSSTYHWFVFAMDADGVPTMISDPNETLTASDLQNQGYKLAFRGWSPIVVDGEAYDWSTIPTGPDTKKYIFERKHARTILAWDDDYWYLLAIEGQIPFSPGADFDCMYALCKHLGFTNAFNMDGGGSVQVWLSNPTENIVTQNKHVAQPDPRLGRRNTLIELIEKEA